MWFLRPQNLPRQCAIKYARIHEKVSCVGVAPADDRKLSASDKTLNVAVREVKGNAFDYKLVSACSASIPESEAV